MKRLLTLTWWLSRGYRGKLGLTMFSIVFGMFLTIALLTLSATVHATLNEKIGHEKEHLFMRRASVTVAGFDVQSTGKAALDFLGDKIGVENAGDAVSNKQYVDDKDLQELKKLEGVKDVHPEVWSEMPAMISGRIKQLGNKSLGFDLILLGVEPDVVAGDSDDMEWIPGEPIPILVPKSLIIAYNTGYAEANRTPRISEDKIVSLAQEGIKLKITVGRSSTKWKNKKSGKLQFYEARIAGVTNYGGLLAGIVPYKAVQHLQGEYKSMMKEKHDISIDIDPDAYTGALIVIDEKTTQGEIETIKETVQKKGFDLVTSNSTMQAVASLLKILDIWISITGLIILFSGGIALAQVYRLLLSERQEDFKTLRYFGASLLQLVTMLLIEIMCVTMIAIIVGTGIGLLSVQMALGTLSAYATEFTGINMKTQNITVHEWTYLMGGGVLLFIALLVAPMLLKLKKQETLKVHS